MKKTLSFLLLLVSLLSLFACGKAASTEKEFARGTVSGNKYVSEFAGLTLTVPESWFFYTDDQISELSGVSAELLGDNEKLKNAMLESLIDAMAVDPATGNNINFTFENLKITTGLAMTDEKYAAAARNTLIQSYEEMGAAITVTEPEEFAIGGTAYRKIVADVTLNGTALRQACYIRKIGGWALSIAVTSMDGTDFGVFEAMFS